MDYASALTYIHGTYKFGSKLGLDNITRLLDKLDNPQDDLKVIHVAGTNGKGSTVSFISKILESANYRVGIFTSPFLERFNERIRINDDHIPDGDLGRITGIVREKVEEMLAEGHAHPTEFEIVTAIAFVYYKEAQVDYVALEVGLGGRMDSTNVVKKPIMTVITPVALDHTEFLGDTLYAVAGEKAGILKDHVPCVVYPQQPEAMKRIEEVAAERNAELTLVDFAECQILRTSLEGTDFTYKGKSYKIGLCGTHQVKNAIVAMTVVEQLVDKTQCTVTHPQLLKGLETTKWGGRFEVMSHKPLVIIDGAHNLHGAEGLDLALETYLKDKKLGAVIGILGDKSYEEIIELLAPRFSDVVVTEPDNPRALPMDQLGALVESYGISVQYQRDISKAVDCGLALKDVEGLIIFGSLYMIGAVRTYLNTIK
jgi:dihydrofolate synthase/folylpolyglutamate synthase